MIVPDLMGSQFFIRVAQVLKPTPLLELLLIVLNLRLGMLVPGRGQAKEVTMKIGWSRKKVAVLLTPCIKCPISSHPRLMDIIIWNSRGALKPNFQSYVGDLVHDHNPTIMVVMETKIGGARAKETTDRLPFDGAIHSNTIGYAGGLWLL